MKARSHFMTLVASVALVSGCSGDATVSNQVPVTPVVPPPAPGVQQMGFSEKDLVEAPQRIGPGQAVALFLEAPGQTDPDFDTGTDGTDLIPFNLPGDARLTLELGPDIQVAAVRDAVGRIVLQGQPAAPLPAGVYSLELAGRQGQEGGMQFLTFAQLSTEEARIRVEKSAPGADFSGIDLTGELILESDLTGCKFVGGTLNRLGFLRTTLNEADFTGSKINNILWTEVHLVDAILDQCEGEDPTIRGSDLSRASFVEAKLRNTSRPDRNGLRNNRIPGGPPDFSYSQLIELIITQNQWPGAIFTVARLDGSTMGDNFDGGNFESSSTNGTKFIDSNGNPTSLSRAIWKNGEILPEGQKGAP